MKKYRKPLILLGIAFALSALAGVVLGQLNIPLGCAFILSGIYLLSMRRAYADGTVALVVYAACAVSFILGAVLLVKGVSTGLDRQDDLRYTQSLNVSAEELLAMTGSTGTQYAVVLDGVISRRLLPVKYRAQQAEDIGAVLVVATSHKKTGSYSNGGTAYRTDVAISLKSLKTGETLGSTTLYGGEPPKSVRLSPLDPNKDRYGSAPSEEEITNACVSLIEAAQREEERASRVTLLSEEELLAFIHQIIAENAGEDGWAGANSVQRAIKAANPDFSISDYGYASMMLYYKSDPHFAVKERDLLSDAVSYFTSQDYVRWVGE